MRRWLISTTSLVGQRLVALGDDLDARHLGDAGEIGERHGRESGELNFLRFQRRTGARAVREDAKNDLVQLRLALAPVVGIFGQAVIFARLVFGEFERTGADRLYIGRIGGDVGAFVEMLRHDAADDRQCVADQLQWGRLRELEDGGRRVRRFDGFEIGEDEAAEILQRLPDAECRIGDVSRGERLAIVPFHAFAQLEGDRLAVGGAFPGGGEARCQPVLAVEGGFGEGFDHLARDKENAVRGDNRGVEVFRLGSAATIRRPPAGAA